MNYCYYIFTPKGVNYFLQYLLLIFFGDRHWMLPWPAIRWRNSKLIQSG